MMQAVFGNVNGSSPLASRTPLKDLGKYSLFSPSRINNDVESSSSFDNIVSENERLKAALAILEKNMSLAKQEKDKYESEIRRLTRLQSQSVSTNNSSDNQTASWATITAASRDKARLEEEVEDLKTKLQSVTVQLSTRNQEFTSLKDINSQLEKEITITKSELSQACNKLMEAMVLEKKYNNLKAEHVELVRTEKFQQEKLLCIKEQEIVINQLQNEKEELNNLVEQLRSEIQLLKDNHQKQQSVMDNQLSIVTKEDVYQHEYVLELKSKLMQSEARRKELLNKVQELKGNIRVYVRCRPILPNDKEINDACVVCNADSNTVTLINQPNSTTSVSNVKPILHNFNFDRIFNQKSSQEDVYNEVSDLIQSALDGYRICIFSYGQTGSGKCIHALHVYMCRI